MCGRYSLFTSLENLIKKYNISNKPDFNYRPRKEIFPSQKAPVIRKSKENKEKEIKLYKWGFSPSFASSLIINARGETIHKKPTFKKSFLNKRCIIPVTSFFEWKKEKNQKIRHTISIKNKKTFSLAGIYDNFKNEDGKKITAYCIITTSANNKIKSVHSRMPVILKPAQEKTWLNNNSNKNLLKNMLKPYPDNYVKINKEK